MPSYVDVERFKIWLSEKVNEGLVSFSSAETAASLLRYAPAADVATVIHSHWIHTGEYLTNSDGKRLKKLSDLYVCHRCHRVEAVPEPYCNCGAQMDEEIEEDA